jgi:hypothetical protein
MMVGGVVTTQCIHQRRISNKPVFIDVAAKVHEFIDKVDTGCGADKQPADIRCQQKIEQ